MAYVQAAQLGRGPSTMDKINAATNIAKNIIGSVSSIQDAVYKPTQLENDNALKQAQITASGSESDLRDSQQENLQRELDYAKSHGGLTPTEAASLANSPAEQARIARTGQLVAAQQALDNYNKNTTDANGKFVNPNGSWNGLKSFFGLGDDKSENAKGSQTAFERALNPTATDKEIELGIKSHFPTTSGNESDSSFAPQRAAQLKALALQAGQGNRKDLLGLLNSGSTPKTLSDQDSAAVQWAKSNPNNPKAAQILQINGAMPAR